MANNSTDFEDNPNTINILLMGETGVGKSTFINSFANYINFTSFDEARKGQPIMIIPTQITVYDENTMEDRRLVIGSDKNEKDDVGSSATQAVKTYLFPIENDNKTIRLIDTPGIGDTNGPDKDDQNCEGILAYLAQLLKLNAICLLMKPSNDRNTILFSYCIRRILSQLHKSACDNVVFVFTNTKGCDYRPGSTFQIIKKMAEEIAAEPPYVKIQINKDNMFCLDNESFKHLLALDYGVQLNSRTLESCKTSWFISCEQITRLLNYVYKLTPHNVKKTVSINNTRELILQLSKPLSDVCQLLEQKLILLKTKEEDSKKSNQTIEELQKKLYKPGYDLEIIKLDNAATVCTNIGCAETIQVGNTTKTNYRRRCHDPCLLGYITYESIGHWSIMLCSEFTKDFYFTCKHCKCSYKKHMTIYYDTKIVEKQFMDKNIEMNLLTEKEQREKINKLIQEIKEEKSELEDELQTISKCAAKFAYFLENNSITSSYDNFKEYIYLSIQRQKSLGNKANLDMIHSLTEILNRHENLLKKLKENKCLIAGENITEENIYADAENLFKLKHTGVKIKEIFDARAVCVKKMSKSKLTDIFTHTIPNWFMNKFKN